MMNKVGKDTAQKYFSLLSGLRDIVSFKKIITIFIVILLVSFTFYYLYTEHKSSSGEFYRFVDNFPTTSFVFPSLVDIAAIAKNYQVSEWVKASLLNEGEKQYLNLVSLRPQWVGNFRIGFFDSLSAIINISFRFNSSNIEHDQAFGVLFIASPDRRYMGGIKFNKQKTNSINFSIIIRDFEEETVKGVHLDRILI